MGRFSVATVYSPVMFPPAPLLVFAPTAAAAAAAAAGAADAGMAEANFREVRMHEHLAIRF